MSSSVQARFDETLSRADDLLRERLRREEQELARQDASLEEARRQRQRANFEARREIQATYADAFEAFGTQVPAPVDDEPVARYRARLFNRLARRLPQTNEWADTRADDIPSGTAMDKIEMLVLEAAQREGERPSTVNLPSDGSMIMRQRVDPETNERSINWYGRESFVKQLSRGGQKVARIVNPKTGDVLWGAPFDRAR